MTFNKFEWLKALRVDPRLTDRECRVAMAICTDYTRRDGGGWAFELDAWAAAVPSGMSRNRLKSLLQKLIGYGYLVETGRTLGGRGMIARRSFNLVKPAPPAVRVRDETRNHSGSNPYRQRFKPAPITVRKVSTELHKPSPTGTSTGTFTGGTRAHARDVTAPSDAQTTTTDEPPPTCRRHPDGPDHGDRCFQCGRVREYGQRQAADAIDQSTAERTALRTAIDACTRCDSAGRLDDLSDCHLHSNFRAFEQERS